MNHQLAQAADPTSVSSTPTVGLSTRTEAPVAIRSWRPWSQRTWLATTHLVLDLPIGLLWGTLVIALVAAAIALVPLALLGGVLLALTLAGSLLAARVERQRARLLLGTRSVASRPIPRTWSGWLRLLVDRRAWLSCLYAVALLPLGILNASIVIAGWSLALAGLTSQVWAWLLPSHTVTIGSWSVEGEPAVILTTALAALLACAMPAAVRLLAAVDGWLVRTLLP